MDRFLGQFDDGTVVESVLTVAGGAMHHRYRVVGGALDGREFDSLFALGECLGRVPTGWMPASRVPEAAI